MGFLPKHLEPRRLARKGAYLLALALLLAGVLRPVLNRPARAIEYLFVFDLSLSMATEDYTEQGLPKSRLEVAKDVFRRSLTHLPVESRLSLGGFAGGTIQIFLLSQPVSDRAAIEDALGVLEWDNVWDVGSRIDRVMRDIAIQMEGSRIFDVRGGQPILAVPLNIVIFSDGGGDDVRGRVGDDAAVWLRRHARVTFLGLGRTTPSTVPEPTRTAPRDCLRRETGECLVSRLNEANLTTLADHLEGHYERLLGADRLGSLLRDDPLRGAETDVPIEVGWLFSLGALVAFVTWRVL